MIGIVYDPTLLGAAFKAAYVIRKAGIAADIFFDRSYKSQMRMMDKRGYKELLLIREDGMFSKDMTNGETEVWSVEEALKLNDFY